MSGQVLWLVVWCAGKYVGRCDFEGGDLFGKPYACMPVWCFLEICSQPMDVEGAGLFAPIGAWLLCMARSTSKNYS